MEMGVEVRVEVVSTVMVVGLPEGGVGREMVRVRVVGKEGRRVVSVKEGGVEVGVGSAMMITVRARGGLVREERGGGGGYWLCLRGRRRPSWWMVLCSRFCCALRWVNRKRLL